MCQISIWGFVINCKDGKNQGKTSTEISFQGVITIQVEISRWVHDFERKFPR